MIPFLKENTAVKMYGLDYSDEDKDYDEAEQEQDSAAQVQERYLYTKLKNRSSEASEAEEEEDEADRRGMPLSIKGLSKAETQALINFGSGEDDNEEEVEEFEAGPVDVQTSLQVTCDGQVEPERTTSTETSVTKPEQKQSNPEHEEADGHSGGVESIEEAVMAEDREEEMGSGNTSQKSDEGEFEMADDPPLQLTVMCEEELQKRIVEEQQNNNLSVEILNGLGGNAKALKEPGAVSSLSV